MYLRIFVHWNDKHDDEISFLSAVMAKFLYVTKGISCKLSYAGHHALNFAFLGRSTGLIYSSEVADICTL